MESEHAIPPLLASDQDSGLTTHHPLPSMQRKRENSPVLDISTAGECVVDDKTIVACSIELAPCLVGYWNIGKLHSRFEGECRNNSRLLLDESGEWV